MYKWSMYAVLMCSVSFIDPMFGIYWSHGITETKDFSPAGLCLPGQCPVAGVIQER